ncbi:MAG: HAMP domain-containing histidine kinase [Clostridia bacterium]|nr:HAMP domain-containing histidine kinase [Clostridia bacterium]
MQFKFGIKPLWAKLVVALMAIAAIAFVVSGLSQLYQVEAYIRNTMNNMVTDAINNISKDLEKYLAVSLDPNSSSSEKIARYEILEEMVERETRDFGNAHIWLVNSDGYIWSGYPEIPAEVKSYYEQSTSGNMKLPEEAMYLLNTEDGNLVRLTGNFYSVLTHSYFGGDDDTEWYTFVHRGADRTEDYETSYTVIISMPASSMTIQTLPILRIWSISLVCTAAICLALALMISRPMSRQIRSMRLAAQKVSTGDFDVEPLRPGKDELGDLVRSFNRMMASLKNLEKMRSEFVSNISHELRTPMTSILGFIEGMQDGTIPRERHDYYLTIIRDEVNRLHKLTNDLLELTRIESGQKTMNMVKTNISEICRRSVISLGTLADEKRLEIQADLGQNDIYAVCDRDMIMRVVMNILHNAIKFTPEGGVIAITVKDTRGKVLVSVRDSGSGLTAETLEHIWERFYKADKSRGENAEGMGLGMSMARNIIKEHGEDISAYNSDKGGAVFTFTLSKEKH